MAGGGKKIKNTRNKQKHKTRGSDVDYLVERNSAELLTKQMFKRNIGNDFKGEKSPKFSSYSMRLINDHTV